MAICAAVAVRLLILDELPVCVCCQWAHGHPLPLGVCWYVRVYQKVLAVPSFVTLLECIDAVWAIGEENNNTFPSQMLFKINFLINFSH